MSLFMNSKYSELDKLSSRNVRRSITHSVLHSFDDIGNGHRGRVSASFISAHEHITKALEVARDRHSGSLLARAVSYVILERLDTLFRLEGSRVNPDCALRAAMAFSKRIDKMPLDKLDEYHFVPHYLDMALVSTVLAAADFMDSVKNPDRFSSFLRRRSLSLDDLRDMYVFGLLHDYMNPGGKNSEFFELENITWKAAEPILRKAGYKDERLERMHILLLATDPDVGPTLSSLAVRFHMSKAPEERAKFYDEIMDFSNRHKDNGYVAYLCKDLFADPVLAKMAYLATKGDIAFSVLSLETYLEHTQKFHVEHENRQTGMRLMAGGKPLEGAARYFWDKIAVISEKDPIPAVEEILLPSARATKEEVFRSFEEKSPTIFRAAGTGPQQARQRRGPRALLKKRNLTTPEV
jgi:hypothetical protein